MNSSSKALKDRFNFETPESYKCLEEKGALQWKNEFRSEDLNASDIPYFWLHDMEWYRESELNKFEFEDYHKEGFIPFAHTGGGDYWCWSPTHNHEENIPVLLCPHDCEEAEFYAPNFSSALFRHALEYAASIDEDERELMKNTLTRLLSYYSKSWNSRWVQKIDEVKKKPLTWQQYEDYIQNEFGEEFVQKTIIWMN